MLNTQSMVTSTLLMLAASQAVRADYTAINLTPTVTSSGQPTYTNAYGLAAAGGGAGGVQGGFASDNVPVSASPPDHALIWSGTAASFVDVNPTGAASSDIYAVSATTQVGDAVLATGQTAGYWNGSASSFTALPTGGLSQTEAHGVADTVNGPVIVGFDSNTLQALLWTKTATTPYVLTNLQTSLGAGYSNSYARATDGITVAGQATTSDTNVEHAVVWNVVTHAASDINGTNIDSDARGVSGNQVVGYGDDSAGDLTHALLWTFTSTGYIETDLNPAIASTSEAYATNGNAQVGEAVVDDTGNPHAYVWTEASDGTVSSFDLQSVLPSTFVTSTALGIDAAGDIVGYATDADGNTSAILWTTPAPEPASLGILAVGMLGLWKRKRQ